MPPKLGTAPSTIDSAMPFLHRKQLDFQEGKAFDLQVDIWASVATTIRVTGMTKSESFEFKFTSGSGGVLEQFFFGISDIPIFLCVRTDSGGRERGTIYAETALRSAGAIVYNLLGGYITTGKGLSWPYGLQEHSNQGRGSFRQIDITDPAAGVELTTTIPAGQLWRVHAFRGTLVTDSTAANRLPGLKFDTSSDDVGIFPAAAVQTASLTVEYIWGIGLANLNDGLASRQTMPLPADLWLNTAQVIATVTTNIVAGDNWGEGNLWIEQLLDTQA